MWDKKVETEQFSGIIPGTWQNWQFVDSDFVSSLIFHFLLGPGWACKEWEWVHSVVSVTWVLVVNWAASRNVITELFEGSGKYICLAVLSKFVEVQTCRQLQSQWGIEQERDSRKLFDATAFICHGETTITTKQKHEVTRIFPKMTQKMRLVS